VLRRARIELQAVSVFKNDRQKRSTYLQSWSSAVSLHVGLLLFPRVTQLDLTGPLQMFSNLPGATVRPFVQERLKR
jgi:hypothetical protein